MHVWKAITRFVAFASICGVYSRHNSFRLHRQNLDNLYWRKSSDSEQRQYRKQLLHAIRSAPTAFQLSKSLAKCFGFASIYQKWTRKTDNALQSEHSCSERHRQFRSQIVFCMLFVCNFISGLWPMNTETKISEAKKQREREMMNYCAHNTQTYTIPILIILI